jgi:hypothetical protein
MLEGENILVEPGASPHDKGTGNHGIEKKARRP